jgi:hypothetical protein
MSNKLDVFLFPERLATSYCNATIKQLDKMTMLIKLVDRCYEADAE